MADKHNGILAALAAVQAKRKLRADLVNPAKDGSVLLRRAGTGGSDTNGSGHGAGSVSGKGQPS